MKRLIFILALTVLAAGILGAGGKKESAGSEKQYHIGFVQLIDNLAIEGMRGGSER